MPPLPARQPSYPPGLEAPHSAQEQVSSRVVRMVPVAEGDALPHSEESVNHSEKGHSGSLSGNQLPSPSASLSKVTATEVQNIHSQRHVGIELFLVHELAHDSNSPQPLKPHDTCIQLQLSQLLGDQGDEVAGFSPAVSAVHGSGPSIDDALVIRTRKEITNRGRWRSDRSVLRYEQRTRPHKPFRRPPAPCQAYALKCENVLHKLISGHTPIAGLQLLFVR